MFSLKNLSQRRHDRFKPFFRVLATGFIRVAPSPQISHLRKGSFISDDDISSYSVDVACFGRSKIVLSDNVIGIFEFPNFTDNQSPQRFKKIAEVH